MEPIREFIIRNIFESLPVGVLIIDPKGEIGAVNDACCDILGFSRQELEAKGWGILFLDGSRNLELNQVIVDVIQEETVNLTREVFYDHPHGKRLRLSITSSYLSREGEVGGLMVLFKDVSESYFAHLREKEILKEKNRIQEQRVKSMQNLALSVAHQIRNPVMSIGGFAGLAMRKLGEKADSLRQYLDTILDEASRLEQIVKAVAEYASIPPADCRQIRLSDVLDKARRELDKHSESLSKPYGYSAELDGDTVWADPDLLVRVMAELLKNALEYSDSKEPKVEVGAKQVGRKVVIRIKDNGRGIPEEDIPYIFDPFYTTKPVSVGMGLAVVKHIVDELAGTISYKNSPPGTTVKLTLPARNPAQPEQGEKEPEGAKESSPKDSKD